MPKLLIVIFILTLTLGSCSGDEGFSVPSSDADTNTQQVAARKMETEEPAMAIEALAVRRFQDYCLSASTYEARLENAETAELVSLRYDDLKRLPSGILPHELNGWIVEEQPIVVLVLGRSGMPSQEQNEAYLAGEYVHGRAVDPSRVYPFSEEVVGGTGCGIYFSNGDVATLLNEVRNLTYQNGNRLGIEDNGTQNGLNLRHRGVQKFYIWRDTVENRRSVNLMYDPSPHYSIFPNRSISVYDSILRDEIQTYSNSMKP